MGKDFCAPSPSPWVVRFAPLISPGGRVLDLACGGGRHSRLFLDRNHPVTAIDRDIAQAAQAHGAELIEADLEDGSPLPLAGRQFDGIVITNYLWRPIYPWIISLLAPGGVLIHETFALGHEALGRPRNPDFLLQRGELLRLCAPLTIAAFEDGQHGHVAVTQRICALNAPGPAQF